MQPGFACPSPRRVQELKVITQNVTPFEITAEIRAFCRQLDPTREPIRVPVRAFPGAAPGNDYVGLKDHVAHHGGRIQFGWILWEQPGWFLEAEFHGVWVTPGAELIDLGPRGDGATSLLFLPDSRRTYQGVREANRFFPLSQHPEVLSVVQSAELHARLRAEAETQSRRIRVAPGSASRNDPCPCGSGLKYKKCCGRGQG
jgi:hypothetical protein